jgi:hypothetical protein
MKQVDNYRKAFMGIFKNIKKKPKEQIDSQNQNRKPAGDDIQLTPLQAALIEEYVREIIQDYLDKHYPNEPKHSIIKLACEGWPNPPLDWCDATGRYVGEIKYTRYVFAHLDDTISLGVGIPEWKLYNLRLACGFRQTPDESFFRFAWFVYCDVRGEVYYLSVSPRIDSIMDEALEKGRPLDPKAPYVHYGRLENRADRYDAPLDFTKALLIPSVKWTHMGTIPEIKMLQIKSSAASIALRAAKRKKKDPHAVEEV